jgi:hypothetical protein
VGRSAEEAAAFLGVKRQTISRFEAGDTLCRRRELSALVAYYGGTDEQIARAVALWDYAKQETVRLVLPSSTSPQLRSYLHGEADAAKARIISPLTVHGLFQTYEYANAIAQAPSGFRLPEPEIERMVEARISRQGRLAGPQAIDVHIVMDESVVRRVVGGRAVMRGQIARLLQLGDQANVTLQVAPFDLGAYGTMSGDVTVLDFPDNEDPPAAYLEYVGGGRWVEDPDSVARLATTFDLVASAALTPADTVALLQLRIEEMADDS